MRQPADGSPSQVANRDHAATSRSAAPGRGQAGGTRTAAAGASRTERERSRADPARDAGAERVGVAAGADESRKPVSQAGVQVLAPGSATRRVLALGERPARRSRPRERRGPRPSAGARGLGDGGGRLGPAFGVGARGSAVMLVLGHDDAQDRLVVDDPDQLAVVDDLDGCRGERGAGGLATMVSERITGPSSSRRARLAHHPLQGEDVRLGHLGRSRGRSRRPARRRPRPACRSAPPRRRA